MKSTIIKPDKRITSMMKQSLLLSIVCATAAFSVCALALPACAAADSAVPEKPVKVVPVDGNPVITLPEGVAIDPAATVIKVSLSGSPETKVIDAPSVTSGKSAAPVFLDGVQLTANGKIIQTCKHSSPCLADWNNNGIKDLILGHIGDGGTGGFLRLYINSGTDAAPVFTDWKNMESDGKPIELTGA